MRYLSVGDTQLSVIGLGCWQFGAREWGYGSSYTERDCQAIIQRALQLGINFFDTAELYGAGNSELILGRALRFTDKPTYVGTKFIPLTPFPNILATHCRASLQRLDLTQLFLYQIHWPNPIVPLRIQMRGMRQVMRAGLVVHAGVSNYSERRWRAAEKALGRSILSNQIRYNLVQRHHERETLAYAQDKQRIIIAYSPLAQGLLSGKYTAKNPPRDMRRLNSLFTPTNLHRAQPIFDALHDVARQHTMTASQIALAYVAAQPRVLAIPGAKSPQQLEDNVAAANLELTSAEIAHLRGAADAFHRDHLRSFPGLISNAFQRGN